MAVYTTVTEQDIETLLSNNLLGTLKQFSPMSAGISNTHYKLTTSTGEFVLTIFEHADIESLQTKLMLEEFLVSNGYPASAALPSKNDYRLQTIVNKPCKLSILLPGQSVQIPNLEQLNEVGQMLAELHLTSVHFQFGHELLKNDDWISRSVERLLEVLPTADALMLSLIHI